MAASASTKGLEIWDILVLILYFCLVIGTSIISMIRHKRNTVDSYFLAGRNMNWVFVGASLFASNIGSEHFIGLAGSGAASGIAVGAFEFNSLVIIQLLGWIFLPVFIASGVATLPEYMSKRFGGNRIRVYLSVLSLVLYIFTKISVNLYSGALFIKLALGWNLYYSVLLILFLTGVTSITGGLAAVIYTDTMQSVIMITGGITLAGIAYNAVGGYEQLYIQYMNSLPQSLVETINATNGSDLSSFDKCGLPNKLAFTMLRGITDKDMPWLGFLLGQTPASIWYWCSDQMMVQRTLSAKTLSHAQGGTLLGGYLKILPLFIMIIPGMISRVLYTETLVCTDPDECMSICGSKNGCTNIAYPMLIMNLMPSGLRGLMLAVMLAALMSDLTSIFNSSATLFTVDIYTRFKKNASNRQLMIVGRLFVLFMVGVGILWIPIIQNMHGAQLYIYIQSIAAYLSPPIAGVYTMAILSKRANEKAAFWSLMGGMVAGVARMILDFVFTEPPCGEPDNRPFIVKDLHYMYFALIIYWLTIIAMLIISFFTKSDDEFRLIRTTFWTRKYRENRPDEIENYNLPEIKHPNTKIEMDNIESSTKSAVKTEIQDAKSNRTFKWYIWKIVSFTCGFDSSPNRIGDDKMINEKAQRQAQAEQKRKLDSFLSLNQSRNEKIILRIALVIIIVIAIGLYTFFSIPPQYTIFKSIYGNLTLFPYFEVVMS